MSSGDRSLVDFAVSTTDLDAIADQIETSRQAMDLTSIGRHLARVWLTSPPGPGATSTPHWAKDPSVRVWDPAGHWSVGNRAIVACFEQTQQGYQMRVRVGSIVKVVEGKATIRLDGRKEPAKYSLARPGSTDAETWRKTVEEEAAKLQRGPYLEDRVEAGLAKHGERVFSLTLEALQGDPRFVSVADRWYLAKLTTAPSEEQLGALAWKMVRWSTPQTTEALLPQVRPPLSRGAPGLFGLELALRQHPELFKYVSSQQPSGWVLAGPPPGSFKANCAAYDPETYDVLCQAGDSVPPEVVAKLWASRLLGAVL